MLSLQKDIFAKYVAEFQKEGEGRLEFWTPAPSFHSPRIPVPSPLLLPVWSLSSRNPLLQAPTSFLSQSQEFQPRPLPLPPPPNSLSLKNLILIFFFFLPRQFFVPTNVVSLDYGSCSSLPHPCPLNT